MQPRAAKAMAPRTLTTVNSILTLPETLQVGGRHPAVVECCRSPIKNPWNSLKRRKPLVPPCRSSARRCKSRRSTTGGAIEPGDGASSAGTAIAEVHLVDGAVPDGDAPKAYQVDFVDGELVAVGRGGFRGVRAGARTGRRRPPHGGLDGSTQLGLPMGINDNSGDGGG